MQRTIVSRVNELLLADAVAARTLLSEQGLTHIEPYLGSARSMSEAAARTGSSLRRTFYWTTRLCEVGLVRARREIRRGGRPIRLYQAVADSFRVRAEKLPVGLFESMMTDLNRGLIRSYEAAHPEVVFDSDVCVHRGAHESGVVVERSVARGAANAPSDALQSSFTTRLSPGDAARLRVELAELRDRWISRGSAAPSGHPAYLTVLTLTPLISE